MLDTYTGLQTLVRSKCKFSIILTQLSMCGHISQVKQRLQSLQSLAVSLTEFCTTLLQKPYKIISFNVAFTSANPVSYISNKIWKLNQRLLQEFSIQTLFKIRLLLLNYIYSEVFIIASLLATNGFVLTAIPKKNTYFSVDLLCPNSILLWTQKM